MENELLAKKKKINEYINSLEFYEIDSGYILVKLSGFDHNKVGLTRDELEKYIIDEEFVDILYLAIELDTFNVIEDGQFKIKDGTFIILFDNGQYVKASLFSEIKELTKDYETYYEYYDVSENYLFKKGEF